MCDANAHSEEFLGSKHTDATGECAQEFSELFHMEQSVDFPTREDNILDLIYNDTKCNTSSMSHLGTTDHLTIVARVDLNFKFPDPPAGKPSMHYWRDRAPWDNNVMRGHLRSQFRGWDARQHGGVVTVDGAIDSYYKIIDATVDKYDRKSNPTAARPAPWCDHKSWSWDEKWTWKHPNTFLS